MSAFDVIIDDELNYRLLSIKAWLVQRQNENLDDHMLVISTRDNYGERDVATRVHMIYRTVTCGRGAMRRPLR